MTVPAARGAGRTGRAHDTWLWIALALAAGVRLAAHLAHRQSPFAAAPILDAELYDTWARGGAGLLLTGNVMVDRRFLERPGNVVVDRQTDRESLRAWARCVQDRDSALWMQISHPGRQCSRHPKCDCVACS